MLVVISQNTLNFLLEKIFEFKVGNGVATPDVEDRLRAVSACIDQARPFGAARRPASAARRRRWSV